MSVIATALKHMLAAGMDHAAIVLAVSEMEALACKDESAERRREKDRERKRNLRNSAESSDSEEYPRPDKEKSPLHPLKEINPTPSAQDEGASAISFREVEKITSTELGNSPLAANPDVSPVMACIRDGATLDDVRNGIRWRMANGPPPRSWHGVTGPIMQAHANRTKPAPERDNNKFGNRDALRPTVQDAARNLAEDLEFAERRDFIDDPFGIGGGARRDSPPRLLSQG